MKKDADTKVSDTDSRVKKLLEFRETIDSRDLVPVLVKEAADLIKNDPFAFMLAAVLDRGTKTEIIWTIPYYNKHQLGRLDPFFFANASTLSPFLCLKYLILEDISSHIYFVSFSDLSICSAFVHSQRTNVKKK